MRAHHGHRRGLHQHDAVAGGAVPALVLAGARLRRAAPVRHALPAAAVFSWFVFMVFFRFTLPMPGDRENWSVKGRHGMNTRNKNEIITMLTDLGFRFLEFLECFCHHNEWFQIHHLNSFK